MYKWSLALGVAALSSCASVPKPSTTPAAAVTCASATTSSTCASALDALNRASEKLHAIESDASSGFALEGRVAISQGRDGGNANIDWRAETLRTYTVALSAPITGQSWRLEVTPAQATVHGMKGGPRSGADPTALLKQATGWTIPVTEMRYWIQARPAPGVETTDVVFQDAAATRLLGFTQSGWTLSFEGLDAEGLPRRIFARKGDNQVRLIVDQWAQTPSR